MPGCACGASQAVYVQDVNQSATSAREIRVMTTAGLAGDKWMEDRNKRILEIDDTVSRISDKEDA